MSGAELLAWGSAKSHPDVEEIKRLQKRVEQLNDGEFIEEDKAELLATTKQLDDLLLK